MKYLKIILFLLIATLTCCKKSNSAKPEKISNDSIVIYSIDDYYKSKSKKKKIIDTLCVFEEKRAKTDLRNGKLTYTLIYGLGLYDYSNKEMSNLLSNYSISLDSVANGCDRPPKGFSRNCYEKIMNSSIEKKLGNFFIDSLRKIADRQFFENHPKHILHWSECDLKSRYSSAKTYDEFLDKPEDDFIKGLNYPNMSRFEQSKQKANTEISFVIYRNGSIGKIKVESDFTIAQNINFAKYFEKQAIKFVKNAHWKAAKYRGIDVNSTRDLNLYNK